MEKLHKLINWRLKFLINRYFIVNIIILSGFICVFGLAVKLNTDDLLFFNYVFKISKSCEYNMFMRFIIYYCSYIYRSSSRDWK